MSSRATPTIDTWECDANLAFSSKGSYSEKSHNIQSKSSAWLCLFASSGVFFSNDDRRDAAPTQLLNFDPASETHRSHGGIGTFQQRRSSRNLQKSTTFLSLHLHFNYGTVLVHSRRRRSVPPTR